MNGQCRHQQGSRGGAALAKSQRTPDEKGKRQVGQRIILNPMDKPGIEGNQRAADQADAADDGFDNQPAIPADG